MTVYFTLSEYRVHTNTNIYTHNYIKSSTEKSSFLFISLIFSIYSSLLLKKLNACCVTCNSFWNWVGKETKCRVRDRRWRLGMRSSAPQKITGNVLKYFYLSYWECSANSIQQAESRDATKHFSIQKIVPQSTQLPSPKCQWWWSWNLPLDYSRRKT
jgi:hypothetical protein